MNTSSTAPNVPFPTGFALCASAIGILVAGLVLRLEEAPLRGAIAAGGLVACTLLALHPLVLARLRALSTPQVAWVATALVLWTVVLPAQRFDPYMFTIVLVAVVASVHACAQLDGRLTAVAVVVWICLWLPLDLRWFRYQSRSSPGFFLGTDLGYNSWALCTACMGVLSFGVAGRFDIGVRRASLKGPLLGLGIGIVFGLIAIPVGLATGFLSFKDAEPPTAQAPADPGAQAPANPGGEAAQTQSPDPAPSTDWLKTLKAASMQLLVFFVIALTIAFPEELFFRGILDRGLVQRWKRPFLALLVSSVLFGLMHWNNRRHLDDQLVYLGLASLAGLAYGLAFRKGGLLSAIFLHALVDWVWQLEFSK